MNWINNFIEELQEKSRNKDFLKNNSLFHQFQLLKNECDFLREENNRRIEFGTQQLRFTSKLDGNIITQKGRITRQTNEQNKELEASNLLFDNIFNRLIKIEKKLIVKGK